jgi:hypothetical protein
MGLWWVKRMGGLVVVHDPAEARFNQMARMALWHVPADYVATAHDIGPLLVDLARGIPRAALPGRTSLRAWRSAARPRRNTGTDVVVSRRSSGRSANLVEAVAPHLLPAVRPSFEAEAEEKRRQAAEVRAIIQNLAPFRRQ